MNVAVFSTKPYDEEFLSKANTMYGHALNFLEARLTRCTARLAENHEVVCAFVNDELDRKVLELLSKQGVKMIALRCAGFNNIDLDAAESLDMTVARVPAYSPHAVAEHSVAMMLSACRKLHRAHNRTREGNFSLDGLLGFDMYGKTAGVIGTGKIGALTAEILIGFGCQVLAFDLQTNERLAAHGVRYVPLDELLCSSDIITLHCPLLSATHHMIDQRAIEMMKDGVMLVNTSRGGLIDTVAVIDGLKSGKIGSLAIDVYEEEADVFFEDYSNRVMQDDILARLLTFPNVLVTGHQGFFTAEALDQIAHQTLRNISAFEKGETPPGLIERQKAMA